MTNQASRPSPDEASQALESITASKQALGDHVRSPVWLYPVQGVGMGLFIIGLVFSKEGGWASGLIALSAIIFCALPLLQARGHVVTDVYTHPGSRGLALAYVLSFVLVTAAALALYALFSWIWAAPAAAVVVLVLTMVMGPAMDARLARALRNGRA